MFLDMAPKFTDLYIHEDTVEIHPKENGRHLLLCLDESEFTLKAIDFTLSNVTHESTLDSCR
jgi:hypothetical protein